jgi:hypothetical protein
MSLGILARLSGSLSGLKALQVLMRELLLRQVRCLNFVDLINHMLLNDQSLLFQESLRLGITNLLGN